MQVTATPRTEQAAPALTASLDDPIGNQDSSALTSDFETFLRMLTVQLQNQDPLNPVEASDYAVQLATFSGVEQQVKTNQLLSDLGNQMQLMSLGQFAGWVGMEARHSGAAHFNGAPVDVQANPAAGSDSAELIVRDATDTVVQRIPINASSGVVQWAGVDAASLPFPSGKYSFFVESFSGQQSLGVEPAEVYSLITEARNEADGAILGLAGGGAVDPSDISGIRSPGT